MLTQNYLKQNSFFKSKKKYRKSFPLLRYFFSLQKKNMSKKLVCILAVFVALLNACSYNHNADRYAIKDVSQPCNIILSSSDTTTWPSSVSIHIMGVVDGECTFEIENGAARYNTLILKDTIDYLYENEWYEHKINLKYHPGPKTTGDSIVMEYRMR